MVVEYGMHIHELFWLFPECGGPSQGTSATSSPSIGPNPTHGNYRNNRSTSRKDELASMQSHRILKIPTLAKITSFVFLIFQEEEESPDLDLSDDEELHQAFDLHSLIVSSLQQEPLFTAEEVINEIEGMMEVGWNTRVKTSLGGLISHRSSSLQCDRPLRCICQPLWHFLSITDAHLSAISVGFYTTYLHCTITNNATSSRTIFLL